MEPRKPPWLKKRLPPMEALVKIKSILDQAKLHTVCEEARCPNLGECFAQGTATFLIMGRVCTRNCAFCAVEQGLPSSLDPSEPQHVAEAVQAMKLRYVVITSVTRDDLPDGGASHFVETIRAIHSRDPDIRVEVLIPDFKGDIFALGKVLEACPDVLNHNVETIPRLYPRVRPQSDYARSLELLEKVKTMGLPILTKSGLMLGLGEQREEVLEVLQDLRKVGCDFLTMGQYLQPRSDRLPVFRYLPPEEFEEYKRMGEALGFETVASGPFVRSSFHAFQMFESHP